jgi:hypothetical protein
MPTKNMKLLMLNALVDAVVEIPTRLEVKTPIFNIAFADSSSNAKSNPLTKFSFAIILERWFSSFLLSEDDLVTKDKDDVIELLINDNIVVETVIAITTIANISMIDVIIGIMF